MSLKRYYISGLHPHIWEHPEGEMVYFEDYVTLWAENARLKAEVERLRASSFVTAVPVEQYERLRKAGDAMEIALQADFNGCPYEPLVIMQAIRRWRAAKEGKPSV